MINEGMRSPPGRHSPPQRSQESKMSGPVVHTYRAAESGLYVNSYLVEGASGVVVVDTNLLVSDIEALSEAAKSELRTALQTFLPDAPLAWVIELGADAVAAELAAVGVAANGS
jgi:hypothetical protein